MDDIRLQTRYGAEIEVLRQDVEAFRHAGDVALAERQAVAERPDGYVRPSRLQTIVVALKRARDGWDARFERAGVLAHREEIVSEVLAWGRGTVTCPACKDLYRAVSLNVEEARWDGIYRRRFYCPAGHVLWETPDGRLGDVGDGEFDWRPVRCSAPWE